MNEQLATVSTDTVVVSAGEERELIVSVLRGHGATESDAQIQAEMLVEGDLRGQASHGIRCLQVLAERLLNGTSTSGVAPAERALGASRIHINGNRGLGPVVAEHAIERTLQIAAETGTAVASIENSGHVGMLGPYVEQIADSGNIGIALTTSEALVAPWNGARAMVGTNPVGIGVPTASKPLVLDMSTAAVSAGKIIDYAERGEAIPLGWAVDNEGRPTTDASAAREGAIAPFGGPKGFALGVAFEALVGLLSNSSFGRDVHGTLDTDQVPTKGDLFIVIAREAGSARSLQSLTDYFDQLRTEGAEGKSVLIPGDRARALRMKRLTEGIPLDVALWDQVTKLPSQP